MPDAPPQELTAKAGLLARPAIETPSPLDELVGFHLRRAQVHLFQNFRDNFSALAITPGQVGILLLIAHNPGASQTALARCINVKRATLGETLNYLVAKCWVQRRADPRDKRVNALFLTAEGQDFLADLIPALKRHESDALQNLSRTEAQTLLSLLRKLAP